MAGVSNVNNEEFSQFINILGVQGMKMGNQYLSPALFVLVLLCFALPFVTISCSGEPIVSLGGYTLVTGTQIDGQEIPSHPLAVLLLLVTISGIILGFLKIKRGHLAAALVAVVGVILSFSLKNSIVGIVAREGKGVFATSFGAGYYLPLLLFLAAAGINFFAISDDSNLNLPGDKQSSLVKYCHQCGSPNPAQARFCKGCGIPLNNVPI